MSATETIDLGHTDLATLVYKKVKNLILRKELRLGQKIVQEELASQLGVSRTPLIKALQRLESELLVESIPRQGMFVKKISEEELIDAFECREVLEGVSARRAAARITDTEIAKLRALFAPFQGQDDQIDVTQYVDADVQFHKLISEISNNQIIARLEILENIHRNTVLYIIRLPKDTLKEHLAVIDALERRDGDAAERLMRAHLKRTRDSIALASESQVPNGDGNVHVASIGTLNKERR